MERNEIYWIGPFSWPGYEKGTDLDKIPDTAGVYLITFQYTDGYLVYGAGISKSIARRFREHSGKYRSGAYAVLNAGSAKKGKREVIWPGWGYASRHPKEFAERGEEILQSVEEQLKSHHIFIAEIPDARLRARIEAAIIFHIYDSNEPWAELADRGMHLEARRDDEIAISLTSKSAHSIYGLPQTIMI